MYSLVFDAKAIEFLEKCEKVISKRIWDKLMSVKLNPHHYFVRLEGRTDYKLRVGDYRAIADIDDSSKKIEITLIEHRKKVYKK